MELQVETGVDRRIAPNFAHVDMGQFKVSTARPLYTNGAATCMNVVVHNETTNIGGLAHIAMGGMTGLFDIELATRFDKANRVITTMINQTGSSGSGGIVDNVTGGTEIELLKPKEPSGVESLALAFVRLFNTVHSVAGAHIALWLGAGSAYSDDVEDFPAYITRMLSGLSVTLRIIDERKASGSDAIVYSPFNARVYKMVDGDLAYVRMASAHAAQIQRERRERLSSALSQYFA